MPSFSIQDLIGTYNNFARNYLFYVSDINGIFFKWDGKKYPYLVNSTSIPETTINVMEVDYQGNIFKKPLNQTFNDWSINFTDNKKLELRTAFEEWMEKLHNPYTNEHSTADPSRYSGCGAEIVLHLLDSENGNTIRKYVLSGAFPKSIGASTLDYSTKELLVFEVTFSYQYHIFKKM